MDQNVSDDIRAYFQAAKELAHQPVIGSSGGTYHVKNGVIHVGYVPIQIDGFSNSTHNWEIMH